MGFGVGCCFLEGRCTLQTRLCPILRIDFHILNAADVGADVYFHSGIQSSDVTVVHIMQFAGGRVEAVIGIDQGDILHGCAVTSRLEQRPRVRLHIFDVLFRIPDGEVGHAGTCIHFDKTVGNAGVCGVQHITGLRVVPPALYLAIVVGGVFTYTYFKNGAEHFAVVLLRVGPIAA